MTQRILIGVGGSGQHVVHAYLRLLTLTFPLARDVPHVFIVDADALEGVGQEKRSDLIENIFGLHEFLVKGSQTPARCQLIHPMRVDQGGAPLAKALGPLLGVQDEIKPLAHGFLADAPGECGSDWDIELAKGMMANPKVGSIVLAHKAERAKSSADTQLNALFELISSGDARIAIAGSNFGGTGSGVIPALVRQLDPRPGVESVRAFMCLPWFSIDPVPGDTRKSAARTLDGIAPMARNSSLGLHTYFDELNGTGSGDSRLKRSSYVLLQSMAAWPEETRKDDGNFDQRENRHVINLVQASAIQAYFGLGTDAESRVGLFCVKTTAPGEARGQFDAARSPHLRFWAGPNESLQLDDLVADAEATAFVLEKCGQVFASASQGKLHLSGFQLKDQEGIDQFMRAVTRSLPGKKTEQYGWMTKRETAPDDVFKSLGGAMDALATGIRRSLVWLDAHSVSRAGHQSASVSGVTGISAGHLFGAPQFGDTRQTLQSVDSEGQLKPVWNACGLTIKLPEGGNLTGALVKGQAFVLLRSLFVRDANGGDPVDALIAAFNEERKYATGDTSLEVAARTLARAIHQRVKAARLARHTEDTHDARQKNGSPYPGEGSNLAMLNLVGLTPTPADDCRLARLDLKQQNIGDHDPFDANYPLSLAYVDPYLGLRLENGAALDLTDRVLPEHGLQGIPNIAAPQLMQRWRLQKCRPLTETEKREPAFIAKDDKVRGTRAGVYLHARRINEAALWLIVSGDTRVKLVDDLLAGKDDTHSFVRLLRAELRLTERHGLRAIVFANKSEHAGKPIFLWSGESWYLAANSAARQFFTSLLSELPSVRYWYRDENPLAKRTAPVVGAVKSMDVFFADQIRRAVAGLEGVIAQAERREPGVELLKQVLGDLLEELPPPSATYDEQSFGKPESFWLRAASNSEAEVSVAPHRLVSALHTYFCSPAVVFVDSRPEMIWNGMLPMRAEVWQLLEGAREDNEVLLARGWSNKNDERSLALRKVAKLRLTVRGLGRLEYDWPFGPNPLPMVQEELDWQFGIWPKFRADHWKYYIISGTSRIGDPGKAPDKKVAARRVNVDWMREGMPVALVVKGRRDPGEDLVELGRLTNGLAKRIYGVPEVLELVVNDRVLGSRRIELESVVGSMAVSMLGLDFGTSNTCAAVELTTDNRKSRFTIPLLPGGKLADSKARSLLAYMDSSNSESARSGFLTHAAAYFQVKNSEVTQDAADTIPSEMLVALDNREAIALEQKKQLESTYSGLPRPFIDISLGERLLMLDHYPVATPLLTPLPPRPFGLETDEAFFSWLLSMVSQTDQRVFGDLKWPRGADDESIRVARGLRAVYIEQVLVAALAVLRYKGYSSFEKFVAMQPEALSRLKNTFADTFRLDINTIVARLANETGMRARAADAIGPAPELIRISESVAALHAAGPRFSYKLSSVSVLTVDIGGGTTDVGVALRFGAGERQEERFTASERQEERFTASARFAGNTLLEALAECASVREYFARSAHNELTSEGQPLTAEALKSLLKSELRRGGGHRVASERTALMAKMFLDAIFEYAFRVLHSMIQVFPEWLEQFTKDDTQKLQVLLLGNGFKLYEAFQEPGDGNTLDRYKEQLKARLRDSGLLPAALAARTEFTKHEATKSDLICNGGLDAAALEDDLKEDDVESNRRKILVPAGIVSTDASGERRKLDKATLMDQQTFRDLWLGAPQGSNLQPTRELSLRLSDAELKERFPITYPYWAQGKKSRLDDLRGVFFVQKSQGESFMDVGAIYLTGSALTGINLRGSVSFAKLLSQYAAEDRR